jgi:hypothetical protein
MTARSHAGIALEPAPAWAGRPNALRARAHATLFLLGSKVVHAIVVAVGDLCWLRPREIVALALP